MSVTSYVKAASLDEAAALLASSPRAALVGGGAYLRLGARQLDLAIDLFEAGLDYVRATDAGPALGAMATYRRLETDPLLRDYADGLVARSVADIGGVQLRNVVTVGGTVYRRYAFSNLITALLALDAVVVLHRGGPVPIGDFLAGSHDPQDILAEVRLPAAGGRAAWRELTNTRNDFAVLNVAAVRRADGFRLAVGARPGVARLAEGAMAWLDANADAQDAADHAAGLAAEELEFGDGLRGSAAYRRRLCRTLVRRALAEVLS